MAEKKRKAPSEKDNRPAKRVALEGDKGAATVKITVVDGQAEWSPVIGTSDPSQPYWTPHILGLDELIYASKI